MGEHLNGVKISADNQNHRRSGRLAYHHGDLRRALIAAAEEIIVDRGLDNFSLREAARRANVSPSAPAHHFGDVRGLLTAVAAAAFRRLGDALEAADRGRNANERLRGQVIAYFRFALAERAKFSLMWRLDLTNRTDPDFAAAVGVATRAFMRVSPTHKDASLPQPDINLEARLARFYDPAFAPSVACWSLVHGFSLLAIDGVFGTGSEGNKPEALLASLLDQLGF